MCIMCIYVDCIYCFVYSIVITRVKVIKKIDTKEFIKILYKLYVGMPMHERRAVPGIFLEGSKINFKNK